MWQGIRPGEEERREALLALLDEIRYVIPTQPQDPHAPFSHLRLDYR
jgi:hypothetical protein